MLTIREAEAHDRTRDRYGGVAMCLRTDVLDWLVALAFQSR
jgi:hypothetical protein